MTEISIADLNPLLERQRKAFLAQPARSLSERRADLKKIEDLCLNHQAEWCEAVSADFGHRSDVETRLLELSVIIRGTKETRKQLGRWMKPEKVSTPMLAMPGASYVRREAKGVVGIISPWNYPLSLAAGDSIPALLAGNAVLQKADNQTALTALAALDLARRAGIPEDLWQVVLGRGSNIGDQLLDAADYVMFTGSTESGRHIATEAGRRLVDCSLELGGKNAMVVLDDADLDRAAEGAVRACFSSSGQLCISIERMYVQDSVHDDFVGRFLGGVAAMDMGPAFDFSTQMGTLTSTEQLEVVQRHVDDAVSKGATLLAGGRARPDLGPYFFEPTVLTDVDESMECFAEETFGPLVSIYRVASDDEAVERANATRYGLNASVWSRSARRGRDVAARLRAGTVNVNEAYAAAWGSIDAPMGGMGDSGLGRRHGAGGLLKYTESQTIARQRLFNLAPPIDRLGDDGFAAVMTTALRLMKRAGWR